jgi:hypothetical protein
MAQIDPSIAMGFRQPQVQDPIAATMRAQEVGVNALKMQELQRGVETQNKLREAFAEGADPGTPEGFKRFAAIDAPTALKLKSDALQARKLEGDIKKTSGEITRQQLEQSRERTSDLAFNPSDNNIKAYLEDSILRKEMTPEQAQGLFAQVANMPLDKRRDTFLQLGASAAKRLEQMTVSESQRQQMGVTMRGQDIGAETARRGQDIGRIPVGYRMTPEGTIEAIPGGPTTTNLSPKEIQLRESKFPQATQAVNTFEAKTTELEKDLLALKNHPGLPSITGIAAGRAPGLTSQGRAAEALYDKITARGGFKELQDMRAASPTGGALGNVSNQEGAQLRAAFAAIDRKQDAADVKKAIDTALADLKASKGRVREAYDMTYDYKGGGGATPPPPPPPPAPGAGGNTVTIPGGKVLTFPTPEAAAAYKKAAGL